MLIKILSHPPVKLAIKCYDRVMLTGATCFVALLVAHWVTMPF
ncbi:hypothetical protein [Haliea salexigens]|nr:hypothetical protein [Haliea salexigens]